jgi:chromosome segregation ATPase
MSAELEAVVEELERSALDIPTVSAALRTAARLILAVRQERDEAWAKLEDVSDHFVRDMDDGMRVERARWAQERAALTTERDAALARYEDAKTTVAALLQEKVAALARLTKVQAWLDDAGDDYVSLEVRLDAAHTRIAALEAELAKVRAEKAPHAAWADVRGACTCGGSPVNPSWHQTTCALNGSKP